jgi:hypothetical protein
LPLALQYGMTPQQFWDEDSDLFFAYQKAYYNKVHKQAHINALYNNLAFSTTLSNAFREKGSKAIDFPKEDIFNPFTQEKKMEAENKKFINTLDTSKNNNQLFQIKKIIEERRRNN